MGASACLLLSKNGYPGPLQKQARGHEEHRGNNVVREAWPIFTVQTRPISFRHPSPDGKLVGLSRFFETTKVATAVEWCAARGQSPSSSFVWSIWQASAPPVSWGHGRGAWTPFSATPLGSSYPYLDATSAFLTKAEQIPKDVMGQGARSGSAIRFCCYEKPHAQFLCR